MCGWKLLFNPKPCVQSAYPKRCVQFALCRCHFSCALVGADFTHITETGISPFWHFHRCLYRKLSTFGTACNEKSIKMTTFPFQWIIGITSLALNNMIVPMKQPWRIWVNITRICHELRYKQNKSKNRAHKNQESWRYQLYRHHSNNLTCRRWIQSWHHSNDRFSAYFMGCTQRVSAPPQHWNWNVVILMKYSSLAASKVVISTTFDATSDENFVKMTTFVFLGINTDTYQECLIGITYWKKSVRVTDMGLWSFAMNWLGL